MIMKNVFEDIRPYNDQEAVEAFQRISESTLFAQIMENFYPEKDFSVLKKTFREMTSVQEFHDKFGLYIAKKAIQSSTVNYSVKNSGNIKPNISYSFISNHRDIVMDALILQVFLIEEFNQIMEISFGSNLMINPLIVDIGKVCQMYKTDRSGTARELYIKLSRLSEYLRYTVTEKKKSTWIAQRNGRTKDGLDRTDPGLIKMYSMSGRSNFKAHFSQMNITPVSVSYQYESCDYMKVREIYLRQLGGEYKKHKNEDYESILYGVTQQKGNTTLVISNPITEDEIQELSDNYFTFCHELTRIIDQRIIENYHFWNTNFMAFDLLYNSENYRSKYTEFELIEFKKYIQEKLNLIKDIEETQVLEKLFLQLYAHPIKNKIEWHDYCTF